MTALQGTALQGNGLHGQFPPTAQDTTAQDTTAQDSTAQNSTAQNSTAQDSTAQNSTAQNTTAQNTTAQNRTRSIHSDQQVARLDQMDLSFDIDLPPGISNSDNLAGLPLDQIDHLLDRLNDAQQSMKAMETQSTQQRDSLIARLESLETQVQSSDSKLSTELPYTTDTNTKLDQLAAENARLESRVTEFEGLLAEYEQRLEEQRCRAELEAVELMGECARYKSSLNDSAKTIGKLQRDCDNVETRLRELGEQSETEINRLRALNVRQQEESAQTQQQIGTRLASLHALVDKRDGEIQSLKNEQRKQRTEFEKELATSEINLSQAQDRLVRVANEAAEKVAQAQRHTVQAQAEFENEKQTWQASQQLALQLQKQSQENVVALLNTETEATELKSNIALLEDQLIAQQELFSHKEVSLQQTLKGVIGEVESLQELSQNQQLELDAQSARFEESHRELESDCREFQRQAEQRQSQVEQLQLALAEEKEALKLQQENISAQELSERNAIVDELQQQIERLQSNNQTLNQHLIKAQEESDQAAAALTEAKSLTQSTEQAAGVAISEAERLAQELAAAKQAHLDAEKVAQETRLETEQVRSELAAAQAATRHAEIALEEARKQIEENGSAADADTRSNADKIRQPARGAESPTGGRYPTIPAVIAPQTEEGRIQTETDDSQLNLTSEDAYAAPNATEMAEPTEDFQRVVDSDDPYAAYNIDYQNEPANDVCSNSPMNSFGNAGETSDDSSWSDDDSYSIPNPTEELGDEEAEDKLSDFAKSLLEQLETPEENRSELSTIEPAAEDDYEGDYDYDKTTDYDKFHNSENTNSDEFADDYDADFSNADFSNADHSNTEFDNEERLLKEAQSTVNEMAEHTAFQTRSSASDVLEPGHMKTGQPSVEETDYDYQQDEYQQDGYEENSLAQDKLDESDHSEQEKMGPISAADILARMGHTFDDEGMEPTVPAAEASPNAAWENKPKVGDGEDDDSIDEYMARLLQRVRGDDETAAEDSPRSTSAKSPDDNRPTMEQTLVKPEPVQEERAPLTAAEFRPSRQAPEANSNLSAMRELGNSSARTAITASNRKKGTRITLTFMALTVISASGGLGLLLCTFLMKSITLGGVALAFLAFAGFAGWKTHGLWKTYFTVHQGIEKSPGPRSSSHDEDGLTPVHAGD